MNHILQSDLQTLEQILSATREEAIQFLNSINEVSTNPTPQITHTAHIPSQGLGALEALQVFKNTYRPLISGSSGPRYWGFVTGGATPASIAGDWLASVYDQNTQRTTQGGDCSALIEQHTIELCRQLFNLPAYFGGGFVTGATMSNFTCLAVARQWAGKEIGIDIAREGFPGPDKMVVLAAEPHSSILKSMSMLGLGSAHIIPLKKAGGTREAVDIKDLEEKLLAYKNIPVILVSSGGTVNTVDYDDMAAINKLHKEHRFWWHVDAAFGGFAACTDTYKHLLQGWEEADSITVDCHKWMNVPYESALFFIQEKHKRLQLQVFQNSNAPYLGNPEDNFSYGNYLPENSRRLRALPAWFTLMSYGKKGYQEIVENNVMLAKEFGEWITKSQTLKLLAPVNLNCVCFTVKQDPALSVQLLNKINATGKVYMTPTRFMGTEGIRAAFVNWRTTGEDIEEAKRIITGLVQE